MSLIRSWTRILLSLATATGIATIVVVVGTQVSASAITNTPWSGLNNCDPASSAISPTCLSGALSDFNRARHKEGLGKLCSTVGPGCSDVLPSNFASMSVPNQMLTLTNIDRRDRGLPAFATLSANLNPYTQSAANAHRDPNFPSWTKEGGGNWAGTRNSLWAEYMWMYMDGWGGSNAQTYNGDCTGPLAPGCLSHRRNILGHYAGPRVLGASMGSVGIATLMMGMDAHDWYPNPVRGLALHQLTSRHVRATWAPPAGNGPAIKGYYVKRDGGAWIRVTGRSWTSPSLASGAHSVSVKSFDARGSSPIRTVHIAVK